MTQTKRNLPDGSQVFADFKIELFLIFTDIFCF